MRKILVTALATAGLLAANANANATVIDFNSIPNLTGAPNWNYVGNSLNLSGFNFTNDCTNPDQTRCLISDVLGYTTNADPGGRTLSNGEVSFGTTGIHGLITTLSKIGGGAFDFNSIDLADGNNALFSGAGTKLVNIVGTYAAGGTISSQVTLDTSPGLETFTFDWLGLSQVTIGADATNNLLFPQMDNIVLDYVAPHPSPQLPEPAPLTLMGIGLLGLGLIRRKDR